MKKIIKEKDIIAEHIKTIMVRIALQVCIEQIHDEWHITKYTFSSIGYVMIKRLALGPFIPTMFSVGSER